MDLATIQPVLDWIAQNPNLSGLIVFLIAAGESLALVGIVSRLIISLTYIIHSENIFPAKRSCVLGGRLAILFGLINTPKYFHPT